RRFSCWLVYPGPGVIVAVDKVGDEHSGDHAVGDALTGVAAGDKHPMTAGAMANEGRVIDRVEYLSRPPITDRTEFAEPFARPVLERLEALGRIVGFARTMILAADEQQFRRSPRMEPHIVIGVFGVPVEDVL